MGQFADVAAADAAGGLLQPAGDFAHELRGHRLVALAEFVGRLADGGGEIVEIGGNRLLGLVGALIGALPGMVGEGFRIRLDVLARLFAFGTGGVALGFEPAPGPPAFAVDPGKAGGLGGIRHDVSPYASPMSDKIASTTTIRPMR